MNDADKWDRHIADLNNELVELRHDAKVMAESQLKLHDKSGMVIFSKILDCQCEACAIARKYV